MNGQANLQGCRRRPWRRSLPVLAGLGLAVMLLQAQAAGQAEREAIGIVTDQTRTEMGHIFYQAFATAWQEQDGTGKYSLCIAETPSVRLGSLISVEQGQKRLFQARIPRNGEQIRKMAGQVAYGVFNDVVQTEISQLLFRDADLGREEL